MNPPRIQIGANDFFEELTPTQRPVEGLRQADFHVPDRQVLVVARLSVFGPKGKRKPLQPLAEHPVDFVRPQGAADLLQFAWPGAG
jgi:hypothetical protein